MGASAKKHRLSVLTAASRGPRPNRVSGVDAHNAALRAAQARVGELEGKLADLLVPILEQAGSRAASAFRARAPVGLVAALTAAGPGVTSASTMIALKPRPDEAAALELSTEIPAETLHVTLAYLGETDGPLEAIAETLRSVAADHAALVGEVAGGGGFGHPDGAGPMILLPDVPGLVELRVDVTEALAAAKISYSRDHGFQAHVTVAYRDPEEGDVAALEAYDPVGVPLHFDALLVVRGDTEIVEIPLVGTPPLTAASPPNWIPPAGDEIIDVDALVAKLRTKTDPVRRALVEASMTPGLSSAGLYFDVTNPFTAKVLSRAGQNVTSIAQTTQLNVMRAIKAAYANGLSIPDTATAIQAGMAAAAPARARMIARTELAGAVNGGSLAAAQIVSDATGDRYVKRWLCVPPGTKVSAAGVIAAVRKPYSGELVQISAATPDDLCGSGPAFREFTVTPDHLVLTRRGWIPAGLLDEGDEVVGRFFGERNGLRNPYIDNSELVIEEVFDSALERLTARGMMSTPVYLDGRLLGEKVDIEAPDGGLGDGVDLSVSEPLREFILAFSDMGLDRLLRGGAASNLNIGEGPSLVEGGPDTALITEDPRIAKMPNAIGFDLRTDSDAALDEERSNAHLAGSVLASEALDRSASLVSFYEVARIQRLPFTGHVYDLTTLSGWFFADGFVAHNTAPGAPNPRHELYEGLDGQEQPLDGLFDVGGSPLLFPGDPDGDPGEVCNCRCAAPWVAISGQAWAASRRVYEGQLLRVVTAGGRELAVTPNHPILTGRGWVAAGLLEEGDDLVCRSHSDIPSGCPDVDDVPTEAKERFASLQLAATRRERVSGGAMNFHGDVAEGEVEVVGADDALPLEDVSPLGEHLRELALSLAHREMGLDGYAPALLGDPEAKTVRLSAAAPLNTRPLDDPRDSPSSDAEATREREFALACSVTLDDARSDLSVGVIEGVPETVGAGPSDTAIAEILPYGHRSEAALVCDLLVAHSRFVELDPVIDLSRIDYAGHVFNFSTKTGTYLMGGIVSANCTLVYNSPEGEGEASADDAPPDVSSFDGGSLAVDTPPEGDTVSVASGPFVPTSMVERIAELGLDRPLDDLTPTTTVGRDVYATSKDTEGLYKVAGDWAPEREALHNDIIARHFEGKTAADGKPTAYFTAGGGASGKSHALFNVDGTDVGLKDLGDRADVVWIDPDRIKAMLPEYGKLRDAGDLYAASGVHEESSALAKEITAEAQRRGLSMIVDTTGSSSGFVQKLQAAADAGYEVKTTMFSIPTNEAIVRSMARGDRSGRYVAIRALKDAHAGSAKQLGIWKDVGFVKDWRVYDNSGAAPKLVAEGGGGSFKVYDQPAWDAILAKASERSVG